MLTDGLCTAMKGLFIPVLASRPLNLACSPCPCSCGHRRPVGRAAGHSFQDPPPTEQQAGGCQAWYTPPRMAGRRTASQNPEKVGLPLLVGHVEGGEAT